jgi:hypothetical protein
MIFVKNLLQLLYFSTNRNKWLWVLNSWSDIDQQIVFQNA